jgi:MerR family transcriptional regulator/heat shock protein HspR
MTSPYDMSDETPVYVISVAAQLSGLHPQTLRAYDRLGLVSPGRSTGRGRRYSMRDVLALREVQRLSQDEGVNLSGIKRILELNDELDRSRRLVADLHSEVAQLRVELESTRSVAARLADLLRKGREGPGIVPVRNARVAVWEPVAGPDPAAPGGTTGRGERSRAANGGTDEAAGASPHAAGS